jgi:hypothetical protein
MKGLAIVRKTKFKEVPKWQYQREKLPKPDATKDVLTFGSWKIPHFADARTAVN